MTDSTTLTVITGIGALIAVMVALGCWAGMLQDAINQREMKGMWL